MKKCKYCKSEMDDKAKVCPTCKRKQPGIGKFILIAVIVVVIIAIIGGATSEGDPANTGNAGNTDTTPVEYTAVELKTLFDDLHNNALKAEKDYQNAYVEVTGEISNIDSDGDYISIKEIGVMFTLDNMMCNIKDDAQLDVILTKSVGDTVTIKGKIKSIGEVLGYTLDIDSIQ